MTSSFLSHRHHSRTRLNRARRGAGDCQGHASFLDPPTTTLFSSLRGCLVATHEVKGEATLRLGWQPEGGTALRSVTSTDVTHDGHTSGSLGS